MTRKRKFDGLWYYWYKRLPFNEKKAAQRIADYWREHGFLVRVTPAWDIWRRKK